MRLPSTPPRVRPIDLRPPTTPGRLVRRAMFAAPRWSVPAAALLICHQIGEALVPVVMGLAIDRAIATSDPAQLLVWVAALIAVFTALSWSYRIGSSWALRAEVSVEYHLRRSVVAQLSGERAAARSPGAATALAVGDVGQVSRAVSLLTYPVAQAAALLFTAACLLVVSVPIGLCVLVGAPLTLVVSHLLSRRLRSRSVAEQDALEDAAAQATDLVHGYRVVRGLGAEAEAVARYHRTSERLRGAMLRSVRTEAGFLAGIGIASGAFVVAIAVLAALSAAAGTITAGAFIAIVGLTQFLFSPLRSLAFAVGEIPAHAGASAQRLLALVSASAGESPRRPAREARIGADDILTIEGFRAGGARLDLRIAPGEIVAVHADADLAGALATALSGATSCPAGVRIGEHPLSDLPRGPGGVLVAPHDAHLISGTIGENVSLTPGPADEADIVSALTAAGADELIRHPSGIHAQVGERGARLSGGQRQRVALARALYAAPPVLVLVDPTTAIDPVTEHRIAARLRGARAGARTLVIGRSAALSAVADRVVHAVPEAADA